MAGTAEQERQEQRSFDQLASVDMFRFDLERHGYVLVETRERIYDEELSYVTEGIDRAARTSFNLRRQNGALQYFEEGDWRPYTSSLITGLQVARSEAISDSRRAFLHERAVFDLQQGYNVQALQPGQQLIWHSPYPEREAALYGEDFIKSCGFNPQRKLGFIYRAFCNQNGVVTLESQTVDGNDSEAFAAVQATSQFDPTADLDTLVRVYDGTLTKKYGGHFYAGRRESEVNENAWEEVQRHNGLISHYLQKLENLASLQVDRHTLENQAKQARYAFWAALSTRLINKHQGDSLLTAQAVGFHHLQSAMLEQEQQQAFRSFVRQGRVLSGCGGDIRILQGEDAIMNASNSEIFSALFGTGKESYSFDKRMFCVVCQAPPKEKKESKKWCGPCGICKGCDSKLQTKNKSVFTTETKLATEVDYALAA